MKLSGSNCIRLSNYILQYVQTQAYTTSFLQSAIFCKKTNNESNHHPPSFSHTHTYDITTFVPQQILPFTRSILVLDAFVYRVCLVSLNLDNTVAI